MRTCVSLVLVLALLAGLPGPVRATPTNFQFDDVELGSVFQTIAVLGRFNVIIDPQVARAKMRVILKDVEPLDAMFLIARIQELRVKRVRWEEGSTAVSYAIGRPEKIEKGFEVANSRTIGLKYARAAQVAELLGNKLVKDIALTVDHDVRTNRLLLRGSEEILAKVSELVRDVDLPVPAMIARMTVLAGTPDKQEPIWHGTALVEQGVATRLHLATSGLKPGTAWRISKLAGEFSQRVNSDHFCTLTVGVDATLEKAGAGAQVRFTGEAQIKDGEEVVVGTVEVSPGEVVQLRVRPEVVKGVVKAFPPPQEKAAPGVPGQPTAPSKDGTTDVDLEL